MQVKSESKRAYTTGEIAKITSVHFRTVIRWIEKGLLVSYKLPGPRKDNRVLSEDLLKFLQENNFPIPPELMQLQQKILLVDDDPISLALCQKLLLSYNFKIETASNGFTAGLLFEKFSPHLVFLDLNLPGLSGFDIIKLLKTQNSQTKIIVLSSGSPNDLQKALDLGADLAIAKPIQKNILVQSLQTIL